MWPDTFDILLSNDIKLLPEDGEYQTESTHWIVKMCPMNRPIEPFIWNCHFKNNMHTLNVNFMYQVGNTTSAKKL